MVYPVTVDALHTVFSPYGFVQKIAIFEKSGQHQVILYCPNNDFLTAPLRLNVPVFAIPTKSYSPSTICTRQAL